MPVIPKGIAPFSIKAPVTSHYLDGSPSDSILQDAKRVFDFIQDERHLTAHELYKTVTSRMETWDKAQKQQQRASQRGGGNNKRGFFGNRNNKKADAAAATATTAAQDAEYAKAKAFLQARQAQIVKLEVSL